VRPFSYAAPKSVEEAVALLAENSPHAKPLAGGTDLLVRMKRNLLSPQVLVDVAGIPELCGIELTEQGLRIGSNSTHAEVASSPLVLQHAPAVAAASASIGAIQTRNLATIGGNLVSCVPSLDSAPPLLVLDAVVTVADPDRRWQMPLEKLLFKPHCSALAPNQLLLDIVIPAENLGKASRFEKYGRRKALSLAVVNAAAAVDLDAARERFIRVAIALGAVAPTTIRARRAEAFLTGKRISKEALAEASRIAAQETSPIDDFRASAQYRRDLVVVLTRRVLEGAISAAHSSPLKGEAGGGSNSSPLKGEAGRGSNSSPLKGEAGRGSDHVL
jgi:CO/xanthine dehydrogenase FAD-binding subunit